MKYLTILFIIVERSYQNQISEEQCRNLTDVQSCTIHCGNPICIKNRFYKIEADCFEKLNLTFPKDTINLAVNNPKDKIFFNHILRRYWSVYVKNRDRIEDIEENNNTNIPNLNSQEYQHIVRGSFPASEKIKRNNPQECEPDDKFEKPLYKYLDCKSNDNRNECESDLKMRMLSLQKFHKNLLQWTKRKKIFRTYFIPFWETEKNARYRNLMTTVYIDHLAHNLGNEMRDSHTRYQEVSNKMGDINNAVRVAEDSIAQNKANMEVNKEALKTLQDNKNNCQCKETPVETDTDYDINWSDLNLEPDYTHDSKNAIDFSSYDPYYESSGNIPTSSIQKRSTQLKNIKTTIASMGSLQVVKSLMTELLRDESEIMIKKFEEKINKAMALGGSKIVTAIKVIIKQILQKQLKESEKTHMIKLKGILKGILEEHPLFGQVEQWQNVTIGKLEYLLPKITWDSKGNMAFFSTVNTVFNNVWSFIVSIYLFCARRNVQLRKKERKALKTKQLTV